MIAQVSYGIPENFSGAGLALTPEEGRAYRPKRISLRCKDSKRANSKSARKEFPRGRRSNIRTGWGSDRIQQIEQILWS